MSCTKETKTLRHCIRECAWNEDMTHCTGCYLTQDQLKFWYRLTDEEKETALKEAEERQKQFKLPSSNG